MVPDSNPNEQHWCSKIKSNIAELVFLWGRNALWCLVVHNKIKISLVTRVDKFPAFRYVEYVHGLKNNRIWLNWALFERFLSFARESGVAQLVWLVWLVSKGPTWLRGKKHVCNKYDNKKSWLLFLCRSSYAHGSEAKGTPVSLLDGNIYKFVKQSSLTARICLHFIRYGLSNRNSSSTNKTAAPRSFTAATRRRATESLTPLSKFAKKKFPSCLCCSNGGATRLTYVRATN